MNYKTRDKIGALIWFSAYGASLFIILMIWFAPIVIGILYHWQIWLIVISTLVLSWFVFDLCTRFQVWLESFEDWLRIKLNV